MSAITIVTFSSNASVTLTGEVTSDALHMVIKDAVAIQPIFSGDQTFEGRMYLEFSIDGTNWAKDVNSQCLLRGEDNLIYNLEFIFTLTEIKYASMSLPNSHCYHFGNTNASPSQGAVGFNCRANLIIFARFVL